MDKKQYMPVKRPAPRRLVQLYSALLHNAYVKGFITGGIYRGNAKFLCSPGLNCYSCPGAVGSCPLGALQNALGSAGHRTGWYIMGMLLLFGAVLGRTVCGWLCPMGLVQEILHRIPTLKIRKSRATRVLSFLKYVILAVFVLALPLEYGLRYDLPLPAFCKYLCPAGTLEGAVGNLASPGNASMFSMLGLLFTRKWVVMLAVMLGCIFVYRCFCRFLCPLGAIYGLFNRFSIAGMRVDEQKCTNCGACIRCCGMDIRHVGDHECISCGQCVSVCREGAISLQAGKLVLQGTPGPDRKGMKPEIRKAVRAAAVIFLAAALVWFQFLDPGGKEQEQAADAAEKLPAQEWTSTAEVGHEAGQQLEDFSLVCYDGSVFHLMDVRGKVAVINLWATYCTPCKGELPYFSDLYKAHEGEVAMIAVHPSLITDDPEDYAEEKDYGFPFATDTDDQVSRIVGGNGVLPRTVVLNRRGEVVYNQAGSVTGELLEALFAEAGSDFR